MLDELDGIVEVELHDDGFALFAWGLTKDCDLVDVAHDDTATTATISTWRCPDLSPQGYWVFELFDGIFGLDPDKTYSLREYYETLKREGCHNPDRVIKALYDDVMEMARCCKGEC